MEAGFLSTDSHPPVLADVELETGDPAEPGAVAARQLCLTQVAKMNVNLISIKI